jgi:nucleoside-diphosphate-sugar epimerase
MKRILITGATGFIGSNLTRELVRKGYKPTILARKSSNLWRINDILAKITVLETDLSNPTTLLKDLAIVKPNYIFHLASYGINRSKENDIRQIYETNIIDTLNLLEATSKIGFEGFINTGSSFEYGLKTKPMSENDKPEPIDYYSVSKLAATLTAKAFSNKHNLPIVTIRPFMAYGYYEATYRFIPTVILNGLRGKVINLNNPKSTRDFLFIEDLIDAYLLLLNSKKYFGEIINVGTGRQTTLFQTAELIDSLIGKKLQINWNASDSTATESPSNIADIKKINELLNWKPRYTLEDGIRKTINWFKKNEHLYLGAR